MANDRQWNQQRFVDRQVDHKLQLELERALYGNFQQHDEQACAALLEYKNWADYMDATGRTHKVTSERMREIAARHGTTTDQMKKHYQCHVTAKDKQELKEFQELHEQKQERIDQIAKNFEKKAGPI